MKVLSYLELIRCIKTIPNTIIEKFRKWRAWLRGIYGEHHTLEEFYSQPFKPELITELFEGWKVTGTTYYPKERFNVVFDDPIYYKIFDFSEGYDYLIMLPRTLDDFIRDCERAGVELIWRQK